MVNDEKDEKDTKLNTPAKGGKKMIEVSEDTLKELLAELKETKATVDKLSSNAVATNTNGIQVRKKTREYDYKLRKWEDKIVVGFENMGNEKRPLYVYNIYDTSLRANVQFVNLLLAGQKESVKKINYVDFLRDSEIITARKISEVEHEDIKEFGMIPKKEMAENGYGMFETMVMVPVEVISKTYTFTLQLPEDEGGKTIDIESTWVNL